jgi:adenosylhomocysteine nucleosidase
MSAPLLFLAADPLECSDWVARWNEVRKVSLAVRWARAGKWKGMDVAAIANGAGAARAFAAVVLAGDVSAVCNIGFCGALDEDLRVGDVFVATEIRSGSRTYAAIPPGGPAAPTGAVASIDHVAGTAAEKGSLRAGGASIVEMEAAGAAGAAEDLGVPFHCVRVVSDLAGEDFANDFNAALKADGSFSVARLAMGALASPGKRLTELIRLKHRAEMASKKLGEFLANCTF